MVVLPPAQEQSQLALQDRLATPDPPPASMPEAPCTFSTYDVSWGGVHVGNEEGESS